MPKITDICRNGKNYSAFTPTHGYGEIGTDLAPLYNPGISGFSMHPGGSVEAVPKDRPLFSG